MRDDNADGSPVAENGWHQGAILPPSLVAALVADHQFPTAIVARGEVRRGWLGWFFTAWKQAKARQRSAILLNPGSDCWMVISQDCDLLQAEWSKEPYVEILRIRLAREDEHLPQWLTNPRDIQFSDPPTERKHRYVSSVHDRMRIDRTYLADCRPDPTRTFDRENVSRVCRWITRRYVRAAFPDAFNERAKRALESLTKKTSELSKEGDLLTGIYMLVTEAELRPDEDYRVAVWGTMRVQDFEHPGRHQVAQKILNLLESTLGVCQGIEFVDCQLKSEQDVTLDHLHTWKRWDFDVLSLRPKHKNDALPAVKNLPPDQ